MPSTHEKKQQNYKPLIHSAIWLEFIGVQVPSLLQQRCSRRCLNSGWISMPWIKRWPQTNVLKNLNKYIYIHVGMVPLVSSWIMVIKILSNEMQSVNESIHENGIVFITEALSKSWVMFALILPGILQFYSCSTTKRSLPEHVVWHDGAWISSMVHVRAQCGKQTP